MFDKGNKDDKNYELSDLLCEPGLGKRIQMGIYETFHPSEQQTEAGFPTRYAIKIGSVSLALGLLAAGIYYNVTHDPQAPQKISEGMKLGMVLWGAGTAAVNYFGTMTYVNQNRNILNV